MCTRGGTVVGRGAGVIGVGRDSSPPDHTSHSQDYRMKSEVNATPRAPRYHSPAATAQRSARAPLVAPSGRMVRIVFDVHLEHAPALRSAIDEISQELGGRLEGPHSFNRESALTDAAIAIGALRRAVFALVPAGHPHYAR